MDTLNDMMCEYCGSTQGERLTCCSERHWVPIFDWRKDDAAWERITALIDEEEDGQEEP